MDQRHLPILLTVDETAEILRTTRSAIYARAARDQLPGVVRIGRRLLVRSKDLLRWLDQKHAPSLSEAALPESQFYPPGVLRSRLESTQAFPFGTLSGAVASWFLSPAAKEADVDLEEVKHLLLEVRNQLKDVQATSDNDG